MDFDTRGKAIGIGLLVLAVIAGVYFLVVALTTHAPAASHGSPAGHSSTTTQLTPAQVVVAVIHQQVKDAPGTSVDGYAPEGASTEFAGSQWNDTGDVAAKCYAGDLSVTAAVADLTPATGEKDVYGTMDSVHWGCQLSTDSK